MQYVFLYVNNSGKRGECNHMFQLKRAVINMTICIKYTKFMQNINVANSFEDSIIQ